MSVLHFKSSLVAFYLKNVAVSEVDNQNVELSHFKIYFVCKSVCVTIREYCNLKAVRL